MSNDIVLTGTHGWLGSRLLYSIIHGLPDYPETMMPNSHVRCFYLQHEPALDVELANGCKVDNIFGDLLNR